MLAAGAHLADRFLRGLPTLAATRETGLAALAAWAIAAVPLSY
jgi:hypothetical protein